MKILFDNGTPRPIAESLVKAVVFREIQRVALEMEQALSIRREFEPNVSYYY